MVRNLRTPSEHFGVRKREHDENDFSSLVGEVTTTGESFPGLKIL